MTFHFENRAFVNWDTVDEIAIIAEIVNFPVFMYVEYFQQKGKRKRI